MDTAIAGDTEQRPLRDRPVLTRIHEGRTFDEVVERMASAFAEVAERSYPIYAVVHGAADSDPQIAALLRRAGPAAADRGRAAGGDRRRTRLGTDRVDEIRDSLWVLMSPLQYGLIVRDRGRPVAYYRDWMTQALRALLPPLE